MQRIEEYDAERNELNERISKLEGNLLYVELVACESITLGMFV